MKQEKIQAYLLRVNKLSGVVYKGYLAEVDNTLEAEQRYVNYDEPHGLITVLSITDEIDVIANDEGKLMKTSSGKICASISHMVKTALTVMPFFPNRRLTFLAITGLPVEDPPTTFFHNREILQNPLTPFISPGISQNMRWNSDGQNASPVILSGMLLEHTSMKTGLIL